MRHARVLLAILLAAGVARPATLEAQGTQGPQAPASLPKVTVADQFDQRQDVGALVGGPVVLLVTDRDGFEALQKWQRAFRAAAASATIVAGVADLKGAPRLVRPLIRRGMPRDTAVRVLMDWDGRVSAGLRSPAEHLVAAAFDRTGALTRRVVLPLDRTDPELIAALLRGIE